MRSSCAENRTRSRSASSCTTPPKEPSLAAMQRHGVSTERLTSGPPCSNRQWLVVVKNLLTLRRERGLKEFCSRRGAAQGRRNRKLVWLTQRVVVAYRREKKLVSLTKVVSSRSAFNRIKQDLFCYTTVPSRFGKTTFRHVSCWQKLLMNETKFILLLNC